MAEQFLLCVRWLTNAVVSIWTTLSSSLGFWFMLLVSAAIGRRVLRLIHKLFKGG